MGGKGLKVKKKEWNYLGEVENMIKVKVKVVVISFDYKLKLISQL